MKHIKAVIGPYSISKPTLSEQVNNAVAYYISYYCIISNIIKRSNTSDGMDDNVVYNSNRNSSNGK